MQLYLSSYKFGNDPQQLAKLAPSNKKIAVIANALDFSTDKERRAESEAKQLNSLSELGYEPEILDLRDYFGGQERLAEKFKQYGACWIMGGNVFLLRSAMEQSGLAAILREYKNREDKSEFLYGGFSAGACVLAPSLKGIDLADDPKVVEEVYGQKIIWDGIGLVDYSIVPHYRSAHPETKLMEQVVEFFEHEGISYKTLHDGEVIISKLEAYG